MVRKGLLIEANLRSGYLPVGNMSKAFHTSMIDRPVNCKREAQLKSVVQQKDGAREHWGGCEGGTGQGKEGVKLQRFHVKL